MLLSVGCSLEEPVEPQAGEEGLRAICTRMLSPPHDEFSKCIDYIPTVDFDVARDHCLSLQGEFLNEAECGEANRTATCSVVDNKLLDGELIDVRYVANFYSGRCPVDFQTLLQCGPIAERIECLDGDPAAEAPSLPWPGPAPRPPPTAGDQRTG